jgi:hypothetical protein
MLNRVLTRVAYELIAHVHKSPHGVSDPATCRRMSLLGLKWAELQRRSIVEKTLTASKGRVLAGPFAGLLLTESQSWGDGDMLAKLHGLYEREVLEILENIQPGSVDALVNIGCADGYYAVGAATLLNCPITHAVDLDPKALVCCEELAERNELKGKLVLSDDISAEKLSTIAGSAKRALVISDCEGFEHTLFDESCIANLDNCEFIIECHDGIVPHCTADLAERFAKSHSVRVITEGTRNPNEVASWRSMPSLDRWAMISEGRQQTTAWVHAVPTAPQSMH